MNKSNHKSEIQDKSSHKSEIHSSTEVKSNASANQTQIAEKQNQNAEGGVHYEFEVRILYSIKNKIILGRQSCTRSRTLEVRSFSHI
jgi:hypothetical protein